MNNLELIVTKESDINGLEVCLKPNIPYVITPGLVKEIKGLQDKIINDLICRNNSEYYFILWYMDNNKRYQWRGLDYRFILDCVMNKSYAAVESYIDDLFEIIFLNYIGFGLPVINCSIVDRYTCGVSSEFFLLNKICFFFDKKVKEIKKVNVRRKKVFPDHIYDNNHYYAFDKLDFNKMRTIIEEITLNHSLDIDYQDIEKQFEKIKQVTLDAIFSDIETNNKKLKLLARLQELATKAS